MPWFIKQRKKKARNTKPKKKTQKKQQIFRIKLRNDRFRMFGPHSKPILAVPAWFKTNFGCFSRWLIRLDFGRIGANRSWVNVNQAESVRIREKKKKKRLRRGTDARVAMSNTAPHVRLRWTPVRHPLAASMLHSYKPKAKHMGQVDI